ncbi:Six-hairpin glycosidase-like protein [Gautieria morchelliformis]|nr:Six-hairpin glycosidase-like protein [Gautieria morchelliformis]
MRFFLALFALLQLSQAVPFEEYILAPASRDLRPQSVFNVNGSVSGAQGLLQSTGSSTSISGVNSSVTYDFGLNVAGRVRFTVSGNVSASGEVLRLTYSESSLWVTSLESDGTGNGGNDVPFTFNITAPGTYTVPPEFLRGGFKYLTLGLQTSGPVELTDLRLNYTAMPHFEDMRAYTGYFHSDDQLLNRIWYAGAYTTQLCTISPSEGNALVQDITIPGQSPAPPGITYLNTTITNGSSAVVDGAKRDRLVWPGDYAVAFPAIAVSTYDLISVSNGLDSLFAEQTVSGQLPYAGFPFPTPPAMFSFTYHMYSLIAVSNHFLWSGDVAYLQGKWEGWKRAMTWSLGTIDETGLMNVTSSADWLRFFLGGHAIEANAILYGTLDMGLFLARSLNDTSVIEAYTNNMTRIKAAANARLWDGSVGMYRDNDTSTLHPQDGNVWAIRSGLVQNNSQALSISLNLQNRWTAFGSVAVEAADAISPFITSMELDAHFSLNNSASGLELLRRQWGYMMDDPRMTNSTFIEGYSADGTLHYPPYSNDARISYAHGWATGPTYTLTTYVAGIRLTGPAGKTWTIWPQPGNLTSVEAGLSTSLGKFSVATNVTNSTLSMHFEAPQGTSGKVVIPTFKEQNKSGVTYTIERLDGDRVVNVSSTWREEFFVGQDGLDGGEYRVVARYSS